MKYLIRTLTLFIIIDFSAHSLFSQCTNYGDNVFWKVDLNLYGTTLITNCPASSGNWRYNCHDFVSSFFENGCTAPSNFGGTVSTPYTCPGDHAGGSSKGVWANSPKYVQVASEANANLAYYSYSGLQGDHSAVKEINPANGLFKYISKYGTDGPIIGHPLNNTWYTLYFTNVTVQYIEFWTYMGSIQGDTNFVNTNTKTLSIINNPGVTYLWSIITGYNNVTISSGSNLSSVNLIPTHSGTAKIQLSITGSGITKIQTRTLNITTNVCLEGTYSTSSGVQNINTYNAIGVGTASAVVTCPNATSYIWQKTSGNITNWGATGSSVNFAMSSGGSISFLVTAKQGSITLSTRTINFTNYGSFATSPNPANSSLRIDLNKELLFKVILSSQDGVYLKQINNYYGMQEIDVSSLTDGQYLGFIYFNEKLIGQIKFIIHK